MPLYADAMVAMVAMRWLCGCAAMRQQQMERISLPLSRWRHGFCSDALTLSSSETCRRQQQHKTNPWTRCCTMPQCMYHLRIRNMCCKRMSRGYTALILSALLSIVDAHHVGVVSPSFVCYSSGPRQSQGYGTMFSIGCSSYVQKNSSFLGLFASADAVFRTPLRARDGLSVP